MGWEVKAAPRTGAGRCSITARRRCFVNLFPASFIFRKDVEPKQRIRVSHPDGTREIVMKKIALGLALIGALASCTATERGTAIGAASGAVIGGVVTGRAGGAAVGAVAGGIAGAVIGRSQERRGYCIYRDRYGRTYEARCR